MNPPPQLRQNPVHDLVSLQRLIEHKSTALLVITPKPMVSSAKARLYLTGIFDLDALEKPQEDLVRQLKVALVNKRFPFRRIASIEDNYDDSRNRKPRPNMLPLPKGEGWGEGNRHPNCIMRALARIGFQRTISSEIVMFVVIYFQIFSCRPPRHQPGTGYPAQSLWSTIIAQPALSN